MFTCTRISSTTRSRLMLGNTRACRIIWRYKESIFVFPDMMIYTTLPLAHSNSDDIPCETCFVLWNMTPSELCSIDICARALSCCPVSAVRFTHEHRLVGSYLWLTSHLLNESTAERLVEARISAAQQCLCQTWTISISESTTISTSQPKIRICWWMH